MGHAGEPAGTMTTSDPARDSDVLTLAVAMIRYMLPGAPPGLRLQTSHDSAGTWLHLTCPVGATPHGAGGDPADLTLINSLAARWGSDGNQQEHTLWALLPPPQTPAGCVTVPAGDN
jgi:hypothetical protein